MASTPKIRVLVADDHAILRSGLRMLINAQPDLEVVGEAQDGEDALRVVLEKKPDILLLDLAMPHTGGLKALEKIVKSSRTRVIILTMHDDPAYLRSSLAAGASGYVLKRSVDADLLSAIRAVAKGGTFVDPNVASNLVDHVVGVRGTRQRPRQILSERELQVLQMVAGGYTSQAIADRIFVSVKTVETYRARITQKLGLRSRSDLVRYALEAGLLAAEKVSNS